MEKSAFTSNRKETYTVLVVHVGFRVVEINPALKFSAALGAGYKVHIQVWYVKCFEIEISC
jgi:hypothetical protein